MKPKYTSISKKVQEEIYKIYCRVLAKNMGDNDDDLDVTLDKIHKKYPILKRTLKGCYSLACFIAYFEKQNPEFVKQHLLPHKSEQCGNCPFLEVMPDGHKDLPPIARCLKPHSRPRLLKTVTYKNIPIRTDHCKNVEQLVHRFIRSFFESEHVQGRYL